MVNIRTVATTGMVLLSLYSINATKADEFKYEKAPTASSKEYTEPIPRTDKSSSPLGLEYIPGSKIDQQEHKDLSSKTNINENQSSFPTISPDYSHLELHYFSLKLQDYKTNTNKYQQIYAPKRPFFRFFRK